MLQLMPSVRPYGIPTTSRFVVGVATIVVRANHPELSWAVVAVELRAREDEGQRQMGEEEKNVVVERRLF